MRLAVVLRLSPSFRARANGGSAFYRFVVVFVFMRFCRKFSQLSYCLAKTGKKQAIEPGKVPKKFFSVPEDAETTRIGLIILLKKEDAFVVLKDGSQLNLPPH